MDDYCHREELIAAYLDRTLPEEERLEFEEHLALCNSCLEELISAKSELSETAAEMAGEGAARDRKPGFFDDRFGRSLRAFIPQARPGGSSAIQTALSCCTAIAFAAFLIGEIDSYRFDPGYKRGVYLLDRLLEVRETGALLLSDGASRSRVEIYTVRGNRRLHIGLSLDTAEQLKRTLARYPENAHVLSALGHYHMADGQPELAGIYYERALGDRPHDARALNNLATAIYRRGDTAEAERLLLRARQGKNTPPEVFYNLGVLYGEIGNRELQRIHIEQFLELAPDSPRTDEARRMLED